MSEASAEPAATALWREEEHVRCGRSACGAARSSCGHPHRHADPEAEAGEPARQREARATHAPA